MNKTAKGALAAGTAAVLLLGGAGTLAYWNDSDTVSGAAITAGDLKLDASACDTAGWTVSNSVEGVTDAAFVPTTDKVVPGDVLKKTCDVAIVAVGKNLRATLGVTGGAVTGTMTSDDRSVTGAFTLNANPLTSITAANNGDVVKAVITVTVPLKAGTVDNDSKNATINLADYTVSATQATA